MNAPKKTTNAEDDRLLQRLSSELERCLPESIQRDYDLLVPAMRKLPRGLHAMAATHRLDLSMALDDLGWHFYNFYSRDFADETLWGLRELQADEVADIFEAARATVEPHWDEIGSFRAIGVSAFADWYSQSDLESALKTPNRQMWAICGRSSYGLMQFWLDYARRYPERLINDR